MTNPKEERRKGPIKSLFVCYSGCVRVNGIKWGQRVSNGVKEKKIQFFRYCYLFLSNGVNVAWDYYTMHIARHVMGRRRSRDGRTILTFSFLSVCL
jgi:hypothetical protein